MSTEILRRSQIEDDFEGFDEDALFSLMDGTHWLQAEYKYWYHYAYMPTVEIIREDGRVKLRVVGCAESVAVRQVSGVIQSQIDGEFTGWQGESEYALTNGQVWRQRAYKYEYKYACRPKVAIYDASSGIVMDVEGSRAVVARVR